MAGILEISNLVFNDKLYYSDVSIGPEILLLDEPTSALDSSTANCVMTNIVNYCKQSEITLTIVSHDTTLAKEYGEQIIVIGENKG